MKRLLFHVLLGTLLVLGLFAAPVFAGMVQYSGMLIDSSEISKFEATLSPTIEEESIAPAYGTVDWNSYSVGSCDAIIRGGVFDYDTLNCDMGKPVTTASSTSIAFPIHLPQGALLQYVYVYYYDTHTTSNPSMGLYKVSTTGAISLVINLTPPGTFSGGNGEYDAGPVSETIDNFDYTYYVLAILDRASASAYEGLYKVTAFYKLQVSPAPASARFTDVPTSHPFFRYIEALADAGITSGCTASQYCPDATLTRGQMAVFLSKALGLHFPGDMAP